MADDEANEKNLLLIWKYDCFGVFWYEWGNLVQLICRSDWLQYCQKFSVCETGWILTGDSMRPSVQKWLSVSIWQDKRVGHKVPQEQKDWQRPRRKQDNIGLDGTYMRCWGLFHCQSEKWNQHLQWTRSLLQHQLTILFCLFVVDFFFTSQIE